MSINVKFGPVNDVDLIVTLKEIPPASFFTCLNKYNLYYKSSSGECGDKSSCIMFLPGGEGMYVKDVNSFVLDTPWYVVLKDIDVSITVKGFEPKK